MLGKFNLDGIPPMPRGQPQIEITYDIDANSILNVTAVEKSTGKNNKIVITNDKGRLSKDDIDRLVKEAEKFKDEDNKVKERIESKNTLEQYCYQVRQTLTDEKLKDKFSEDEKKQVGDKVDEVLKWVNDNPAASKEEYDAKVKEIEAVFKSCKRFINKWEDNLVECLISEELIQEPEHQELDQHQEPKEQQLEVLKMLNKLYSMKKIFKLNNYKYIIINILINY